MAPTIAGSPGQLSSLTGLRFFAAGIVVLYHVTQFLLPEVEPVAAVGYTGVTFFFVLSGFVLTWSYTPGPRSDFYWKRFARIYPLHLLMTVAAGVHAAIVSVPDFKRLLPVLLLVQAWIPAGAWKYAFNGVS